MCLFSTGDSVRSHLELERQPPSLFVQPGASGTSAHVRLFPCASQSERLYDSQADVQGAS